MKRLISGFLFGFGLVVGLFLAISEARASDFWENYYSITKVQTHEVTDPLELQDLQLKASAKAGAKALSTGSNPVFPMSRLSLADQECLAATQRGSSAATLSLSAKDLATFVKIGKEVWNIIEKGEPVLNVQSDNVAVLPLKAECWQFLENWQNPVVRTFRTTYKNLYGITMVDFTYKVVGLTGGSYRGAGRYLARVAVVPQNLDVKWGIEFNASVRAPAILNYGTVVDPIAAVQIELNYRIRSGFFQKIQNTENFLVKGSGEILEL